MATEFEDLWNFPKVLGAVDGMHIAIECLKFGGSDFFNYLNFNSIVLIGICDLVISSHLWILVHLAVTMKLLFVRHVMLLNHAILSRP